MHRSLSPTRTLGCPPSNSRKAAASGVVAFALIGVLTVASLVPIASPAQAAVTGIVDCRFSQSQVFDVQWSIQGTAPNRTLNVSGLTRPFTSVAPGGQLAAGDVEATDTFGFYANGDEIGFRQYDAGGSLKRTLHERGTFRAIGPDFIFYNGDGSWGTLISTGEGFAFGDAASLAVSQENISVSEASTYSSCAATPLAVGQTRASLSPEVPENTGPAAGPAPQPVSDPGGGLPVTPPGSVSGSVGGVATSPTPSRPSGGTAAFRVGTLQTRIDLAIAGAGDVRGPGGAPVLRAVRDRIAGLTGGGMRPGGIAEVWMPLPDGGSRQIALLPVDADGRFDGVLPFTGELDGRGPLPIGDRTFQLFGIDENGQLAVLNIGVRIEQPGPLAPEPDRGQGAPPTLSPGQSLATNAGVPTAVTVTPLPDARSTRIQGDGWLMDVDVPEGSVIDEDGAPIIEIVLGDRSVVRGTGFMPGTRAYVWLMSTPTFLGEVTVRADGTFNGTVPVNGVEVGLHTLQLSGVGTDGFIRAANLGVIVTGDVKPRPNRINTGGGPAPILPLPAALLLLTALAAVLLAEHARGSREAGAAARTGAPRTPHAGFDAIDAELTALRRRVSGTARRAHLG